MKLLLDTHIWVWSLINPDRLGRRLIRRLSAPGTEVWISAISVWETLLLIEKKRIAVDREPEAWIDRALAAAPMTEAPLTFEIVLESRRVDLPHPDPADRFLVATARVLDLTLVTTDDRILAQKYCRLMPNA